MREHIKGVLKVSEVEKHEKYLGLPTIIGKSKKVAFANIKSRVWKKIQGWKEKLMSKPGKEVLIKAVIQAIPTYVMSVFLLPNELVDELNAMIARFWWGSSSTGRKIHWKNWKSMCLPKLFGGMGFRDIKVFNVALLAKQGWRLIHDSTSLLARVLKARYYKNTDFVKASLGHNMSYSWRSIWSAKSLLLEGMKWRVGNVESISVWSDSWLPGNSVLDVPTYLSSANKDMKVAELINTHLCCWKNDVLVENFLNQDIDLIKQIPLSLRRPVDSLYWWPAKDGKYTVKSAYWLGSLNHIQHWELTHGPEVSDRWSKIWSLDVPPKLKHFVWRAVGGCLAVKETLGKRHIASTKICSICDGGGGDNHSCFV